MRVLFSMKSLLACAALTLPLAVAGVEPAIAQDAECVPANHVELQPVVRAPADYPADAFNQGIEGFVVVSFDVTQQGRVENLRLVDSDPRGVFEFGVIEAVQTWQYDPPYDYYGNNVRVCGKRQRFSYTLD